MWGESDGEDDRGGCYMRLGHQEATWDGQSLEATVQVWAPARLYDLLERSARAPHVNFRGRRRKSVLTKGSAGGAAAAPVPPIPHGLHPPSPPPLPNADDRPLLHGRLFGLRKQNARAWATHGPEPGRCHRWLSRSFVRARCHHGTDHTCALSPLQAPKLPACGVWQQKLTQRLYRGREATHKGRQAAGAQVLGPPGTCPVV